MSRSLLGAGLGATGATLYLQPEILQNWARDIVFGPSTRPTGPGGKELEQLQRLVEDLSRQVAAGQKGGVTVVHTGTSTTGRYCRLWLLVLVGDDSHRSGQHQTAQPAAGSSRYKSWLLQLCEVASCRLATHGPASCCRRTWLLLPPNLAAAAATRPPLLTPTAAPPALC
jgi:hypothetical protein